LKARTILSTTRTPPLTVLPYVYFLAFSPCFRPPIIRSFSFSVAALYGPGTDRLFAPTPYTHVMWSKPSVFCAVAGGPRSWSRRRSTRLIRIHCCNAGAATPVQWMYNSQILTPTTWKFGIHALDQPQSGTRILLIFAPRRAFCSAATSHFEHGRVIRSLVSAIFNV